MSTDYRAYVREEPERLELRVDGSTVARFAAAVGDEHPDHAATAGATAPPTFAFVLAMTNGAFAFPTDGLIHAEQSFTFERPVRVDERLVIARALTRARRRGEGEGAMWLLTWEATAADTHGTTVFRAVSRLVARPAGERPSDDEAGAGQRAAPGTPPAEPDLKGPAIVLGRERIAAYADVSGDHNPIHLSDDVARAYGLEGVIAHGMLSLALVATVAEDWARAAGGDLAALSGRFVAPVPAGERVRALGRSEADDTASLGLWAEDGGERVRATARRTRPGGPRP